MLDPAAKRGTIFWFTRVLLVQAVGHRCIDHEERVEERALVFATRNDAHPFVRATARPYTRLLKRNNWEPYT